MSLIHNTVDDEGSSDGARRVGKTVFIIERRPKSSTLLGMPPEIRNLIYEYYVATLPEIDLLDSQTVCKALSLASVSKQTREEFFPLFYGTAPLICTVRNFNFDKVARYTKRLPGSTLLPMRLNEHLLIKIEFSNAPYQCAGGLTRWALHRIHAASNGWLLPWNYAAMKELPNASFGVDRSVFRNWYKNSWDPRIKPDLERLLKALELI